MLQLQHPTWVVVDSIFIVCVCIPEPNTPYMAVAMANGAIGGLDTLHNAGHTHSLKLT